MLGCFNPQKQVLHKYRQPSGSFCLMFMSFLHNKGICGVLTRLRCGSARPLCPLLHFSSRGTSDGKDNFLPQNHPVIVRHKDTNTFYLHPDMVISERELTHTACADSSRGSSPTISAKPVQICASESPVRTHLKSQSYDLKKMMFFYNETNPHSGLIGNTKQILYDYFQLIGPVKDSWYKILMHDVELANLLINTVGEVLASDESVLHNPDNHAPSIATIASMLDRVASKKGVSNCKYKSTVTDNLFQIQRNNLTGTERVILEVLAQYAHIDYEVIDHSS